MLFFISSIIISTSDFDILPHSKLPLPVVSGQVNVRGFYFVCPWVIAILHARSLLAKFESILSRGHFLDEELSKLKDKTLAKRFRYSVVGGIHFIFPEGVVIGDVLAHLCATIFMASLFVGPMLLARLLRVAISRLSLDCDYVESARRVVGVLPGQLVVLATA